MRIFLEEILVFGAAFYIYAAPVVQLDRTLDSGSKG